MILLFKPRHLAAHHRYHDEVYRLSPLLILLLSFFTASTAAQPSYELTETGFVPLALPEPGTTEATLAEARRLIALEQPKDARKLLDAWIKANPADPLMVEALLMRGDAKAAAENYYAALFDYEEVISIYPASEQFWTALQREYKIALLYTGGLKRKIFGQRWLSAKGEGAELLIRIQERVPGSALGEQASHALADHYYADGQMPLAADAYDLFLINYPESDLRQRALLRLIQASLARFKGPEFDATGLIDAGERLRQYRDEYPAGADRGRRRGAADPHPRVAGPPATWPAPAGTTAPAKTSRRSCSTAA